MRAACFSVLRTSPLRCCILRSDCLRRPLSSTSSPSALSSAQPLHSSSSSSSSFSSSPRRSFNRLLLAGAVATLLLTATSSVPVSSMAAAPPPALGSGGAPSETAEFKSSVKAIRGHRPYMEDDFILAGGGRFAGVFDGHGGSKVSAYIKEKLYAHFLSNLPAPLSPIAEGAPLPPPSLSDAELALREAFKKLDDEVQKQRSFNMQGSTAVVCYLHTTPPVRTLLSTTPAVTTLISCNVGDSRAVLSRGKKALDLTTDHKPNDARERQRVQALGGKVTWFGFTDKNGNPIEGSGVYRINGNLAVARAIGDASEKPYVSSEVEIKTFKVDPVLDEFILLASDGVWDVMTSQEAVTFVHEVMASAVDSSVLGKLTKRRDTNHGIEVGKEEDATLTIRDAQKQRRKKIAKFIVEECLKRGSSDNICAVVVWLKEK